MIDAQMVLAGHRQLAKARDERRGRMHALSHAPYARENASALAPCFARSARESLAVRCLRLVLAAHEDADTSSYAQAYDCAEASFERRPAVEFVRTISSIARILRRERVSGFQFIRGVQDSLTQDECCFLSALQAAIDGSPVGVEAGSHMLAQSGAAREIAVDMRRLAQLVLSPAR